MKENEAKDFITSIRKMNKKEIIDKNGKIFNYMIIIKYYLNCL